MVATLPTNRAFTLFSPEDPARIDVSQWVSRAKTFLGADVSLVQTLTDPRGELPEEASIEWDVRSAKRPEIHARARVLTVPVSRAGALVDAGRLAVEAMGGAGFDVLMDRTKRVWQVAVSPVTGSDARAPVVIAALIAMVFTAPILPPEGGVLFGVKGARIRLTASGWET